MPTAKPAPPFFLITSAPDPLVRANSSAARCGVQPGYFSRGKPAAVALDQIGTMLSPCSPRISAETCVGGAANCVGDQAAETDGIELRPQADDLRRRQVEPIGRQIRQNIDRVRDHKHDRVAAITGAANLVENAAEQIDVAVDQVQPAFVRFAAQAGRDADQIAIGNVLVTAGRE